MSLPHSLHLLDSHDRVNAREAERAADLTELAELTRDQAIPTSPAILAAAVDLAHVTALPPSPEMWARPQTLAEWEAAKQAADRNVRRAERRRAFQGWWIAALLGAVSSGLVFHAAYGTYGLGKSLLIALTTGPMFAIVPGFILFMAIYSTLYTPSFNSNYDTPRRKATAEKLAAAEATRADLEPAVLTPRRARELTKVPGLGPLLAQAHAGVVPLLGLDLKQAAQRERAYEAALAAERQREHERTAPQRALAAQRRAQAYARINRLKEQAQAREVEGILAEAARQR